MGSDEQAVRYLGVGDVDPDSQEGRDLRNVRRQLTPTAVEVDTVTGSQVWTRKDGSRFFRFPDGSRLELPE